MTDGFSSSSWWPAVRAACLSFVEDPDLASWASRKSPASSLNEYSFMSSPFLIGDAALTLVGTDGLEKPADEVFRGALDKEFLAPLFRDIGRLHGANVVRRGACVGLLADGALFR